jgi:hypothetical protein
MLDSVQMCASARKTFNISGSARALCLLSLLLRR